jgi:hypothetical protein
MGFIKDCVVIAGDIVTLGGVCRLKEAKEKYKNSYEDYLPLYNRATNCNEIIKGEIFLIGEALKRAKIFLDKAASIIKNGINKDASIKVDVTTETLIKVNLFNSGFNSAAGAGVGAIAGGTLAIGSWALVGALGTASTGTAITTLYGIAATNATLAWFGGGALAAGGAGMAGGIAVLGGIVAIPMVYVAAKGTHKKAKDFEDEKNKLDDAIKELEGYLESETERLGAVRLKRAEIVRLCEDFVKDFARLENIVRPLGFFSLVKQSIRNFFGYPPYTAQQLEALSCILVVVERFTGNFISNLVPRKI